MVVQHNMTAINANRYFGMNNSKLAKSLEKLSSGYAINRAGDNAAGLAVSEKMRSQIAGINQGVKNAQDGISMVQTFEGALTETHSILQRMKTLANQSANGTYDNPVDRNAIEQEFLQLNDELDQIADTDFNGVVVLNGGRMADGTRAVDGKIDYANAVNDMTIAENATDISGAQAGTIVDNSAYNKAVADDIWNAIGLDVKNEQEIDITFTFDGEKWNATSASKGGKVLDDVNVSGLSTTRANVNENSGLGGFAVNAGNSSVNVIFDEMNTDGNGTAVKEGDTVTIKFQNTNATTYAPNNAGIAESSVNVDDALKAKGNVPAPTFELDSSITDAAMSDDVKTALDALVAADFTAAYADGQATITATGFTIDTDGTVTHDTTGVVLGKVTAGDIVGKNPAVDAGATGTLVNGGTVNIDDQAALNAKATADDTLTYNGGKWTNGAGTEVTLAEYGLSITGGTGLQNNDTIAITGYQAESDGNPITGADGDVTFKVNVDAYNVADASTLKASSIATPEDATMKASLAKYEVSKSNAFSKSEAQMTYTDNITLQVGARTKDAVNFTFNYQSTAMGDLKSDLNCTAKGLGTDKLTLSTQEDANYAIDKIDQAINKVSMVRGTFGAIQNRLEHKIDNLNVTSENLTSAESRIRDTNMAEEMMNFTKNQILSQASQSMLAQANQLPQGVLSLLQ